MTDLRDIAWEPAIALPESPSARSCNTSLALILRTIDNLLSPRAQYTR